MTPSTIYIEIPARGGSKGVPRKALKLLGDKPLIAYTIEHALTIVGATKVFVNTDDPEIQAVSTAYGAEVPFLRPTDLAEDDSPYEDAHRYALDWYRENENFLSDIVIVMSPTYPFRRENLVTRALEKLLNDCDIFNVGSIAPVSVREDNFWESDGTRLRRLIFPKKNLHRSENLYESAFSFNIVCNRRVHLPDRRVPFELNEIESIDIDEPLDLALARQVVREGMYPFDEKV